MIVLATPTRADVTVGFAADLARLSRHRQDVRFVSPTGIYIGMLREQAVLWAQAMHASYILFVDSDMRFPMDTVDRLLAHGRPIVGANYVQRTMPAWWVSRTDDGPLSSVGKTGLQAVNTTGCGCLLIALSVFESLPRPWFATPYENGVHVGEDIYFCEKARAAGHEVLIDHDLSQQVRHQGHMELSVQSSHAMGVA